MNICNPDYRDMLYSLGPQVRKFSNDPYYTKENKMEKLNKPR